MIHNSSTRKRFQIRRFLRDLFYGFITEYETPKIVTIHSYTVTTLLRIMQMILLLYSTFYLLLYEKGYQKQDTSIISSITLKVKGIGYIQTSKTETFVVDGADYIVPPSENNAIFIMTNFIGTNQNRSSCAEASSLPEAICRKDQDCQNKAYMPNANGRWTGRCLISDLNAKSNLTEKPSTGLCEIQGWCPVENDLQPPIPIKEIRNFTIFIKNFIEFPMFSVKHKNMVENLRPCIFDPVVNKDCPIFRLDYILSEAENDGTERDLILRYGGVIRVKIDWDCNLDYRINLCKPKYSFARLDTRYREETFSVGFNFRFASHWKIDEMYSRSLTKAYGIRLIMSVSGRAGRFDFITLTLNTGSLVGIFGLATFFCDIILLHLTKKAAVYRDFIFQRVQTPSSVTNLAQDQSITSTLFVNPLTTQRTTTTIPLAIEESSSIPGERPDSRELKRLQPSLGLTNVWH